MSGKIPGVGDRPAVLLPMKRSLEKGMLAYIHLGYRSVRPGNQARIISLLKYKPGDSELVQDIKALVIRRIACEALSHNKLDVSEKFSDLLDDFPAPPLMRDYMIPEEHKLGQAQEFIEACRPSPNDSYIVLRAKREALFSNLMNLIRNIHVQIEGVMNYRCKKAEFEMYYSWIPDLVREHLPFMPAQLAELVEVHILKPELPFNIQLPD